MNKSIYKIIGYFAVALLALNVISCSDDFLNEELIRERNYDYFSTPEGIRDATIALYDYYQYPFTFEQGFTTTNYGTDEFTVGGDNSNHDWNDYTSNLSPSVIAINSNTTPVEAIWDNMYKAISLANLVLANVDDALTNDADRQLYKAEASFARAFSYFKLVQQYGGVVLKLEPSNGVDRYFERSSREDCVNQIIEDLKVAYSGLPATEPAEGKLYKDVAAHFLAKALLYRTSEINDDWNSSFKDNDLVDIIKYCDEVIANHPLTSDFRDVFAFVESDGPNEQLPEIIFAAQFSNASTSVQGNGMHVYFISQYNNLTGFTRDIAGGREYQRLRPSDYMYDVYDLENDSRFWKSFRTKQNLNNGGSVGSLGNDTYKYGYGDLGLIYIVNKRDDDRFDSNDPKINASHTGVYYDNPFTGKPTPHVYARWHTNDNISHLTGDGGPLNRFPSLNKWIDGSRPNHNHNAGARDGLIARVSETYLIKAEALIRQSKFSEAISVINIIRERAQFKDGEDRSYYTDGGAAYLNNSGGQSNYADGILVNSHEDSNSYYESLNITETTAPSELMDYTVGNLPPEDEAIIEKLGYSSEYNRMMCFLLNERSRELAGEFVRWQDLARTKTLLDRAKSFNPEAAPNIQEKHYVRPIPQTFLDAIYDDGVPLTPEAKDKMQNPGY
jgi:hypothetical protein